MSSTTKLSRRGVAAIALAAAIAPAQGVVWPPGYDNVPGNSAQDLPFSVSANIAPRGSRSTVLMSAQSLTQLVGMTITEIAFRRDHQNAVGYPAFSGEVDVRMGPIASAVQLPQTQREPFSAPATRVAWGAVNVPAAAATAGLAPFQLVIPLQVPYTYTGGDLGLDILFESNTTVLWRRDAVWVDPGTEGRLATIGAGIPGSNGLAPLVAVAPGTLHPGGSVVSLGEALALPAGQPVFQLLGVSSPPQALGPFGLPAGTTLQLAPQTHLAMLSADRATRFARVLTTFTIPSQPALSGSMFRTQLVSWDQGLSAAIPANVSNGLDFEVGVPPASGFGYGRTLWARGSRRVAEDLDTRIGPVDYVPIIEFR